MTSRGVAAFSGAALRRLRTAARLSQDELAAKTRPYGAKVAGPHVSQYEQGRRKPQLTTLRALAAALGVSLETLLVRGASSADVARLRLLAGWSQQALASRLGIAQARWSRIERGLSSLEESKLRPAAELLKVTVEQLLRALDAATRARGLRGRR
ncbi:helix-turn-helix domain-containing protein [Streptomyces sp. OfavH-34-F]|uniref:helix-turn-helix domain-containing protein n=1 Tax=Streptomyces sp. OfavH-34-F TaxID=2917760 RepID=UPI001EF27525|nr:helix-turn-helix transcriptional regulator [Streptomyces sp. OfavH-34-F]MCG7522865.1 helix-turn-helix domain-containing protein [Streptomyces sp. OfavH-34-F]